MSVQIAPQIKKGKLDSAGRPKEGSQNIATVYQQVLMMLNHPIFDPESKRKHLLDHVFVIASGTITKAAKSWLVQTLDQEARRHLIFMDRDELLDLATELNLPRFESDNQSVGPAYDDDVPF